MALLGLLVLMALRTEIEKQIKFTNIKKYKSPYLSLSMQF